MNSRLVQICVSCIRQRSGVPSVVKWPCPSTGVWFVEQASMNGCPMGKHAPQATSSDAEIESMGYVPSNPEHRKRGECGC